MTKITQVLFCWTLVLLCCLSVGANDDDVVLEKAADHVPIIRTKSSTIYTEIGGKVKLECNTEKLDPYSLVWYNGSQMVTVGELKRSKDERVQLEKTTLVITNVTEKDIGDYKCEIQTNAKPVHIIHKLDIKTPPRIHKPEAKEVDLTVDEGHSIELRCEASGHPTPNISWKIEEVFNLPPTTTGVIGDHGRTLQFRHIERADAGQYDCLATNDGVIADRRVFRLKVLYKPKITIEKLLVPSGGSTNLELTCVVHAEPLAQITWEHKGKTITPGHGDYKRFQVKDSPNQSFLILRIQDIQDKDFGQYSCVAANSKGKTTEVTMVEGVPSRVTFKSSPDGPNATFYDLHFETQSATQIIEFQLLIRKVTPNDRPVKWDVVTIPAAPQTLPRYLQSYNITGLTPASVYEVSMQARNEHGVSFTSVHFRFTTLGGSQRDDASKTPSTTMETEKKEIKSELTNQSGGNTGNGNGAAHPVLDQRAKMAAVMTVVILVAFF